MAVIENLIMGRILVRRRQAISLGQVNYICNYVVFHANRCNHLYLTLEWLYFALYNFLNFVIMALEGRKKTKIKSNLWGKSTATIIL